MDWKAPQVMDIPCPVMSWLHDTYQIEQSGVITKRAVYEDYVRFCNARTLVPKRDSDFGKIVRRAFPGISNRRLGPAGKQISHYSGICKRSNGSQKGSNETSKGSTETTTSTTPQKQPPSRTSKIRSTSKNMKPTSAKRRAIRPNGQQQQMILQQQQQQHRTTTSMGPPAGNPAQGIPPQFTTTGMQNLDTTAFSSAQQIVPNYGMSPPDPGLSLFPDSPMPTPYFNNAETDSRLARGFKRARTNDLLSYPPPHTTYTSTTSVYSMPGQTQGPLCDKRQCLSERNGWVFVSEETQEETQTTTSVDTIDNMSEIAKFTQPGTSSFAPDPNMYELKTVKLYIQIFTTVLWPLYPIRACMLEESNIEWFVSCGRNEMTTTSLSLYLAMYYGSMADGNFVHARELHTKSFSIIEMIKDAVDMDVALCLALFAGSLGSWYEPDQARMTGSKFTQMAINICELLNKRDSETYHICRNFHSWINEGQIAPNLISRFQHDISFPDKVQQAKPFLNEAFNIIVATQHMIYLLGTEKYKNDHVLKNDLQGIAKRGKICASNMFITQLSDFPIIVQYMKQLLCGSMAELRWATGKQAKAMEHARKFVDLCHGPYVPTPLTIYYAYRVVDIFVQMRCLDYIWNLMYYFGRFSTLVNIARFMKDVCYKYDEEKKKDIQQQALQQQQPPQYNVDPLTTGNSTTTATASSPTNPSLLSTPTLATTAITTITPPFSTATMHNTDGL